MFIDEVILSINAGKGGDGCLAYRREKYIPMGGPFGGNGGRGGNIKFVVDEGLHTLIDLRYMKVIKGKNGENGSSKNQNGRTGEDTIIRVPQGTVITDTETSLILGDLKEKNDEAIIATGGRGGRGNIAFKTLSNPCPNFAENGEPGEERKIKVELKLLADVGLVGMPSVGKSTIISCVSKARPKIAAYHFTTLSPNLGVVKTTKNRSFVLADLPGLIENASLGEGLGDRFLKHIERTRVIAHIIDMSGYEGRDPYDDYIKINKELEAFNPKLLNKPQIIIANKMDLENAEENLKNFKKKVKSEVYPVKAISNEGLEKVMERLADILDEIPYTPLYEEESFESHVLYKFQKKDIYKIEKDADMWVIRGPEIEKLLKMTRFTTEEGASRFANKLRRYGIDDKLRELGAQEGDKVRILDFEFIFK